eukprot:1189669-Prorocentrum_minimum.AAC.5
MQGTSSLPGSDACGSQNRHQTDLGVWSVCSTTGTAGPCVKTSSRAARSYLSRPGSVSVRLYAPFDSDNPGSPIFLACCAAAFNPLPSPCSSSTVGRCFRGERDQRYTCSRVPLDPPSMITTYLCSLKTYRCNSDHNESSASARRAKHPTVLVA